MDVMVNDSKHPLNAVGMRSTHVSGLITYFPFLTLSSDSLIQVPTYKHVDTKQSYIPSNINILGLFYMSWGRCGDTSISSPNHLPFVTLCLTSFTPLSTYTRSGIWAKLYFK